MVVYYGETCSISFMNPESWKDISEWEQLMSEYGLSPEEIFTESEQDGESDGRIVLPD